MIPEGGDMSGLLAQAQAMQAQLVAAQQELAEAQVEGTSGGGLVTATMTGSGDVVSVKIKPEAVDPDDVESLEDLVVAALHDAARAAKQLTEERMGPVTGGMGGLGLPGF